MFAANDIIDLSCNEEHPPEFWERSLSPEERTLWLAQDRSENFFWQAWTAKETAYKLEAHLEHVNTALLAPINPAFSQLMVITNGDLIFNNSPKAGPSLRISLQSPTGGFMKASLLQFLAKYVPQKQQIEELIKNNQEIAVNTAQVEINSISEDKITSNIKLFSSSVNLDMNVKFDINIDGGIWSVFEYIN